MAIVSGKPRYYYPLPERPPPPPVDCDVCVYGATSAGISAAVQAASLGKKVALVEFGSHIGGMTTSGLSATDIGDRHVIGGLARRFYRDVGQKCGLDEAWLFEPHVALGAAPETGAKQGGTMPKEKNIEDLPKGAQDVLPEHAKQIYKEAHNHALEEYKDPKKRRGSESLEEAAHKVAWAAVKKEYEKDHKTGHWKKKAG